MGQNNNSFNIKLMPSGKIVQCPTGESVLKAARSAGIHINASCGGSGVCGKCRIKLLEGTLAGGTSEKLDRADFDRGLRHACTSTPTSDISIEIPDESGTIRSSIRRRGVQHAAQGPARGEAGEDSTPSAVPQHRACADVPQAAKTLPVYGTRVE